MSTTLAGQRADLKAKKKGTGKRVLQESWLAPMSLNKEVQSSAPQAHREGLRASNKGFLRIDWSSYKKLLAWVAENKPRASGTVALPEPLSNTLIACSVVPEMLSDLVWKFKKYVRRCVGGSESMSSDAERIGRRWHRG